MSMYFISQIYLKVLCRFRPLNEKEKSISSKLCCEFIDKSTLSIKSSAENNVYKFSFDRTFDPSCSQQEVYEHTAKPIVNSVLEGFNGTILAFGQTSSGKTHTMQGIIDNLELEGIIPRMIRQIFSFILESNSDLEYTVKVSMIEIYQEKIKDLIDVSRVNLQVREDRAKGIYIEDLSEHYVISENEVLDIMKIGSDNRSIGATNMNEHSSRSHSIFILTIHQNNIKDLSAKTGKLFLVDLAGSEKISKTGATGLTLEEAKTINKSLTTLGMVINSLTDGKSSHIPYRESKLTRVLQESLGGNSKTSLIITCSPSVYNEAETLSTLRFGNRAKKVKNKPKINKEVTVAELKIEIEKLEIALNRSKKRINQLENFIKANGLQLIKEDDILDVDLVESDEMKEIKEINEELIDDGNDNKSVMNDLYTISKVDNININNNSNKKDETPDAIKYEKENTMINTSIDNFSEQLKKEKDLNLMQEKKLNLMNFRLQELELDKEYLKEKLDEAIKYIQKLNRESLLNNNPKSDENISNGEKFSIQNKFPRESQKFSLNLGKTQEEKKSDPNFNSSRNENKTNTNETDVNKFDSKPNSSKIGNINNEEININKSTLNKSVGMILTREGNEFPFAENYIDNDTDNINNNLKIQDDNLLTSRTVKINHDNIYNENDINFLTSQILKSNENNNENELNFESNEDINMKKGHENCDEYINSESNSENSQMEKLQENLKYLNLHFKELLNKLEFEVPNDSVMKLIQEYKSKLLEEGNYNVEEPKLVQVNYTQYWENMIEEERKKSESEKKIILKALENKSELLSQYEIENKDLLDKLKSMESKISPEDKPNIKKLLILEKNLEQLNKMFQNAMAQKSIICIDKETLENKLHQKTMRINNLEKELNELREQVKLREEKMISLRRGSLGRTMTTNKIVRVIKGGLLNQSSVLETEVNNLYTIS